MKAIQPARILLVIFSIALALYAQSTIKNNVLDSTTLPLFGGAIALAVLASIGLPAIPLAQPNAPVFEKLGKQYLIGLVIAFALMVLGVLQFLKGVGSEDSSPTGWIFYALSMAVFGVAFIPFGRILDRARSKKNGAISTDKGDNAERVIAIIFFVVLVGVALLVRLNLLSDFPDGVWFDEGANGLVSMKMIQDPAYRPLYVDVTQMPAHFNFIIAFLFQIFGVNIGAIRLAPAIFGVAAVAFTFLLFRRWFNTPIAVFAAAMFAVMRYSLTLSRFGVNGQTNAAFMVISLYFLDRAVRNKKLLDFALAGLIIGMGLDFYYAFRLYAGILFGFGALCAFIWLAMRLVRRNKAEQSIGTIAKSWMVPMVVVFSGILVALAPIIQFAARNPEQFFIRTATVSIFEKRDEPDLAKALASNVSKHLLMWNVRGDGNGRHNIPGEPMLDPFMGALAVVGMGYAVARAHRARNFLMVILFIGMLMGGILSVDFEAPQGYRSNGTMLPLIYFASLPIALVAQTISQAAQKENVRRMGYALAGIGTAVLLFNIGQFNLNAFFNIQRNSASTWMVQSPGETFAGREMKRLAKDYDLVVSSQFANHPSQKFEAPDATNFKIFAPNDLLVFGNTPSRGVAYLLDSTLNSTYQLLKRYFPTAQFVELVPPGGGDAIAYSVAISPQDIEKLLGADVAIYSSDDFSGESIKTFALPQIAADWSASMPEGLANQTFAAEFRSTLYVPQYGQYKFVVSGATKAEIFVDEFKQGGEAMTLGRGNHALRVRISVASTRTKFALTWQGPPSPQPQIVPGSALLRAPANNGGLLGSYYRSGDWSGTPAFTQVDPEVNFYFHNLPLPRPYTVEWKGKVYVPISGTYSFFTVSIDESSVRIDGAEILNNRQSGANVGGSAQLSLGWHDIVMRFADRTSYTRAYLYWSSPGTPMQIIPSSSLLPPMGAYPTPAEMAKMAAQPLIQPNIQRTSKTGYAGSAPREIFKIEVKPTSPPPPAALQPASAAAQPPAQPQQSSSSPVAVLPLQSVLVVGKEGDGNLEFLHPRAVRIGKEGRVFVVDTANKRVQILDANGAFINSITSAANTPFSEPVDVLILPNDEVLILDADKPVLSRFDQAGKYFGGNCTDRRVHV